MKRLVPLLLAGLLSPGMAAAQYPPILTEPPDARTEGMGRAFGSLTGDASAAWSNVGALGLLRGTSLAGSHARLFPEVFDDHDLNYLSVATAVPVGSRRLVLNANAARLEYPVDVSAQAQDSNPGMHDRVLGVAAALAISENVGLGAGIKFLNEGVDESHTAGVPRELAHAAALDLGLCARIPLPASSDGHSSATTSETLLFGLSVQNLGSGIHSSPGGRTASPEGRIDELPRTVRLAVGAEVVQPGTRWPGRLAVSVAAGAQKVLTDRWQSDDYGGAAPLSYWDRHEVVLNGGAELKVGDTIALRGGYLFDDPAEIEGFTCGAGLSLRDRIGFDVASLPQYPGLRRLTKFSAWIRLPIPAAR